MPPSKTALVVRGGWEGHQPVAATELFLPHLRDHGYQVRVEESTEVYADADYLSGVDLVLQCVSMAEILPDELAGLRRAVAGGTGLAGWHGGIADSYRGSSDYLQLIGAQFACHPGIDPAHRVGDASDNFVPYAVQMLPAAAQHPITAGIADFDLVTEQYWVLTDDYLDVLATTTVRTQPWEPWQRPVTSPAIWTRRWGQGKIFVATPGHSTEVLQHPSVNTIIKRGLLWASR